MSRLDEPRPDDDLAPARGCAVALALLAAFVLLAGFALLVAAGWGLL